jgi:hypothetical protein
MLITPQQAKQHAIVFQPPAAEMSTDVVFQAAASTEGTSMLNSQQELLAEVLSKLSLSDRHGSAALVCKSWCSAATAATKAYGVVMVVTQRYLSLQR